MPAVASILLENARTGRYLVRNLSPNGALLLGGPSLPEKTPCRLVLQGPGVGLLRVSGRTVRATATEGETGVAVRFLDVPAEVEVLLRRVVETAQTQRLAPSVLVVDGDISTLAGLAEDVARLGHRTLLALTPLEAVRWLCASDTKVVAAVISCRGLSAGGVDLLAFIRQEFATIHRVLVHGDLPVEERLALFGEARAQACVRRPYTPDALASALVRPERLTRQAQSLRAAKAPAPAPR